MPIINNYKNFFFSLSKSEYIRNASTLMSGTAIAQIIPILLSPIISRLYSPNDYALVAAYNSVTILLTIVATGMYSSALMLDRTDGRAINTTMAAFLVTIFTTVASFVAILIFRENIALMTGNNNLEFWLLLLPVTVFSIGGYETLNMWNNRKKRYKRLATNRILNTIVTSATTISLGLLGYQSIGLIISLLVGQSFVFLLLLIQTYFDDKGYLSLISLNTIKSSFVNHRDFPLFNMPQGFLDGFRESSIVMTISNYFGASILGSYSFALSIVSKPTQLIGGSFSQVFYQRASEKYNDGKEIWSLTKNTILILFGLTAPFFLIIIIFGQDIFSFVFSEKWSNAGKYAQILSLWILFRFITSSVSSIPLILKKQKNNILFGILYNTLPPLMLIYLSSIDLCFTSNLILFSSINIAIIICILFWYRYLIKFSDSLIIVNSKNN